MLRRKLLFHLGPLILILLLTAVGAIWQLEVVLADVRHIHDQSDVAVADIDDFSVAVNEAELELYKLETGREKHLDALIDALATLQTLADRLGSHYTSHDPTGAPIFLRLTGELPTFRQHLEALATVQDAGLERLHTEAALSIALNLRHAAGMLSRYMRDHSRGEQEEVVSRFRWLVLGLSISFVVLINIAVVLLLRIAGLVLRPVDKLVEATRIIASGNLAARVALDQRDEFGELACAYNSMAQRLDDNERKRLEIISQIALTMNHELNNAMSIIELQLQLLARRTEGSPAQEQCLRQIRSGLERMSQTVASLKHIRRVILTDYLPGTKMLDLTRSIQAEDPDPPLRAPGTEPLRPDDACATSPPTQ